MRGVSGLNQVELREREMSPSDISIVKLLVVVDDRVVLKVKLNHVEKCGQF